MAAVTLPDDRREAYEALCRGEYAHGTRESVVFCVYTDDLAEGRGDIYVAAGLGLELVALGHGVRLVRRQEWAHITDADVVVAMLPDLDPSGLPDAAWKVAWVRNEVLRWTRTGSLRGYDQVLASSRLAADRLAHHTDRVHPELISIAADAKLFVPPAAERRDATAVTTANFWGSLRDVHQVLVDLPKDADVTMYGEAKRAPARLKRWHKGTRSYFDLPAVYGAHAFVIDDVNKSNVGFGALNSRLYESAACGALPIVNSGLGLADAGFEDLPRYRTAEDLMAVLRELRADPARTARLAAQTRATVLERHTYERRAQQFVAALETGRTTHAAAPRGRAVHFFPDYSPTNPYQPMLYSGLADVGAYATSVADAQLHLDAAVTRPGGPGTFNIQWTNPILQPSRGPFAARLALDRFAASLRRFKEAGGRLVWTVHNVLPHEAKFRWAEIELAQLLADEADVVHLLSPGTVDAAAPYYRIDPAKTVLVEHSSYAGQYPSWISRAGARARLGITPSEKVLVALGGVRPYKGLDRLVDVFDQMSKQDPALRLLIAGRPGKEADSAAFESRCLRHPRIVTHFSFVPDATLQVWMNAADVAVLAYTNILNSGSFMLSQTFGLPTVLPRSGALAEFEGAEQVRMFDPADDDSLRAAIDDALRSWVGDPAAGARARDAALALARERSPRRMGEQFAAAVASLDG
ncbi:glycosyltransferase family protein [Nocardioides alkalitolerans]|uniref:glycosyltransferase family protein n=1 Tax=Nocardioides alkalitolerans TaxID=281714 RepID=UPI000490B8A3|nr:glycosyltransferase [Nocardioides alkalitolerans]